MAVDDSIWPEFEEKARKVFPKKYSHFDRPVKLDDALKRIKNLLNGVNEKSVARHSFLPFLKIIIKTQRYRYQDTGIYDLETKKRPISFASHFDALIFTYFDLILKRKYQRYIIDKGFSECVLAYRDDLGGRCNIQFAKEIFDWIKRKTNSKKTYTAIGMDIKGYFDTIPHNELKKHWQTVLDTKRLDPDTFAVFETLTAYSYSQLDSLKKHFNFRRLGNKQNLLDIIPHSLTGGTKTLDKFKYLRSRRLIARNDRVKLITELDHPLGFGKVSIGFPQGSPISATLSNVYLIDFDLHMNNFCKGTDSIYRRYCDDILIVCKTKDAAYFQERLQSQLDLHGLNIQTKKTEVIDFKNIQGTVRAFETKSNKLKKLQYLGFEFDGTNVYLRPGSLSSYFLKMKGGIRNTMLKAYGQNSDTSKILIKDLLEKYSHTGKNNFIAYAYRAAADSYGRGKNIKHGFNSPIIKRQLSRHMNILQKELEKENEQRYALKMREYNFKKSQNLKVKNVEKRTLKN